MHANASLQVSDYAIRRVKALSLPIVLGSTFELDDSAHGARLHAKSETAYADGDGRPPALDLGSISARSRLDLGSISAPLSSISAQSRLLSAARYVYSRWGSPTNEGAARQVAALPVSVACVRA